MKPSDMKKVIAARFKADVKRAVYIVGAPGIGKTQVVAQVANELGVAFKSIHAPLLQPEDYGFPVISSNRDNVDFVVSREKFPIEGSDCPEKGILLFDELPQSGTSEQKILANLIHEREIHGKRLKPGWMIVATGNRTTDRAGANRLLSHLKSRVTEIELEASLDDWTQWALENEVKLEVISFIRFKADMLNAFDANSEKPTPTSRAWVDGVSKTLGVVEPALEFETFKGDVGEGAAAEFCAFLKVCRKLPNPDMIFLNPTTYEVPTETNVLYALCGTIAHKTTSANFGRAIQYISRMPEEWLVLYIHDVTKRYPELHETPEFIKWASGKGAKMLA